jgi:hypothetical protein
VHEASYGVGVGVLDLQQSKVEVVDEHPPPNFNPPLTEPDAPILVQVREIFSEPFSLFSHPPTM